MNVLQIMNYSASYRGNFIDSVEAIEQNDLVSLKNTYLFNLETSVKSKDWIDTLNVSGDDIFYLTGNILKDILLLSDILKKKSIDVIHMHFMGIRMHTMVSIAMIGKKIKLVRHFHNHSDYNEHFIKRMIGRGLYRNAIMVGNSQSVAQSIKRDFPSSHVCCINNAISFKRLDEYDEEFVRLSKRGQYSVMMFGADFERKGVDLACKAISNLRKENKDLTLFVICSIAMDECRKKILNCLSMHELPEWIQMLSPRNDIATYYRMCDIFISPSREEGFTYAIPEAVYCGCQVIASNIGGQDYHRVIPGIVWVETENIKELEQAIETCLEDNQNFDATNFVKKQYDVKYWANQVVKLYL